MEANKISIYDELSNKIIQSEKFNDYYHLIRNEIVTSLDISLSIQELSFEKIKFLIESASILACSSQDENKQLAYYIIVLVYSQYKESYEKLKSVIELILVRLGNFPGYALLQKNSNGAKMGSLTFHFEEIPILLQHEATIKKKLNQIELAGNKYYLTDFQRELFDKLNAKSNVTFSAPTSAGKSFILILYIINKIKDVSNFNLIYVVPTKALINQVKNDFRKHLLKLEIKDVKVFSSTISLEFEELKEQKKFQKHFLILTQERLSNLLSNKKVDFKTNMLIIDEAQKINDGSRGVILERSIIQAISKNPDLNVIFSSPLAANPGFFKKFKPNITVAKTNYSPVYQNIIFVNTRKKDNFLNLLFENQIKVLIKESNLTDDCPKTDKAKTAYIAYHIGKGASNILYANGPADTEKLAEALCTYLPEVNHTEIDDLIDFIREYIHKDYSLIDYLEKGVAFHYSKMPREIKEKIEKLFSDEDVPLRYLCCTSTLIEGMNLPAKNVFINKPKKGMSHNMEKFDFWNLAGRAGRLLKDFYGNIFCIDVYKWEGYVPKNLADTYYITSATENSLQEKSLDLSRYLENPKESFPQKERELLEQAASTFILNFLENPAQTVEKFVADRELKDIDQENILKASFSIKEIISKNRLPEEILKKNSGIDPRFQNDLYEYFGSALYVSLLPTHPATTDFYNSLLNIYGILDTIFFNGSTNEKFLKRLAFLSSQWINETYLSSLINELINYKKDNDIFTGVNRCVSELIEIIENTITFKYAKYLKCYNDVLEYHLESIKIYEKPISLSLYLEMGAYRKTTLSLISFGLSRTTAIRLREIIGKYNLDREQCKNWLDKNYQNNKNSLPVLCQEDFEDNFE